MCFCHIFLYGISHGLRFPRYRLLPTRYYRRARNILLKTRLLYLLDLLQNRKYLDKPCNCSEDESNYVCRRDSCDETNVVPSIFLLVLDVSLDVTHFLKQTWLSVSSDENFVVFLNKWFDYS